VTEAEVEEQEQEQRTPSEWAALRKEKKARREAEEAATTASRELAFMKAGIDMDDPKAAYFVRGYDGELTSEAVKAEAIRVGFLAEAPPEGAVTPEAAAQRQAALTGQQAIVAAQQGAVDSGGVPPTAILEDAYGKGGDEAMLQAAEQLGIHVVRGQ
jgi:hypothetical protein